jgi:hypothetical protein
VCYGDDDDDGGGGDDNTTGVDNIASLTVRREHFDIAFTKVRPSVAESDMRMYERLRDQLGMVCRACASMLL